MKRGTITASPMKAPSALLGMDMEPDSAMFPGLMSVKHNGMMGCAMATEKGEPIWRSFNQEEIRMADNIKEMFRPVLEFANEHCIVMVGEFNSSQMNKAGQTLSILAGSIPCPDDFAFKCFYEVPYSTWNMAQSSKMGDIISSDRPALDNFEAVQQSPVGSWEEFEEVAKTTENSNLEGYMLLNPRANWRRGRATVLDRILFKYKYYSDPIDALILDIMPRKKLRAGLSNRRNPAGYAKRVHKKENYEETDIGGVLVCKTEEGDIISVPFPLGVTLEERAVYYRNKGTKNEFDLQGRWLQFQKLAVEDGKGAVSIKGVEFRDGKEEV